MTGTGAFERFRALLLGDEALEARLARIEDPGAFILAALSTASAQGIDLAESDLAAAAKPDPIGIGRLAPVVPSARWPSAGWLPVDLVQTESGPVVDWAHFGGAELGEPFFAASARRAIARPFNRLFRWQTPLADFVRGAEPPPAPDGLIFHWSRCGSTLIAQMLAALPHSVVLSEPKPLDIALRFGDPALLQAMIAALRRGQGKSCFVKLNGWHTIAIGLFRSAFPHTPWIFLFRDPLEILVAHAASPGPEMSPQALPPGVFGLDPESRAGADYDARVLASLAAAAIEASASGHGLFLDYRALPDAVGGAILPHFGLDCGPEALAAMAAATTRDAKRPDTRFAPDSRRKQAAATPDIVDAALHHLAALHGRLQALA